MKKFAIGCLGVLVVLTVAGVGLVWFKYGDDISAGLDAVQIRLQQIPGLSVPTSLIRLVPYVVVIVVLAFIGYTRLPSEAGESYESGDE